MNIRHLVTAMALASTLAACGGGGGGSGSTGPGPGTGGTDGETGGGGPTAPAAFTIQKVSWIQVVKQNAMSPDVALSAGKDDTIFRIDVTGPASTPMPSNATLTLNYRDASTRVFTLTSRSTLVPATVDAESLNGTLFIKLAGINITPDLIGFAINVPGAATPAITGDVDVGQERQDLVKYHAITFDGQTGVLPPLADISRLIARTLPETQLTQGPANTTWTPAAMTTARDAGPSADYQFSGGVHRFSQKIMIDAIRELDSACFALDPSNEPARKLKCLAAFPANVSFGSTVGLAVNSSIITTGFTTIDVPGAGTVSESAPAGSWLTSGAEILVHEYTHTLNVGHANCGAPPSPDGDLYADGSLGTDGAGYDVDRGFYFSGAGFNDFMSYCGRQWTSDKAYRKALNYLASADGIAPVPLPSTAQARTTGSGPAASPSKPTHVVLSYFGGRWNAYTTQTPPVQLEAVTGKRDASFLSSALAGVPVRTVDTHLGQLDGGPYYLPATPTVMTLLKSGIIPGLKFKN